MMGIDKFLKKKPPVPVQPPAPIPNYVPLHQVTHRMPGDIPGILKACDVFVSVPLEEMQAETAKRAEKFCQLIRDWNDGRIGHREFMNDKFHREDVKLDILRNKAASYKAPWLTE